MSVPQQLEGSMMQGDTYTLIIEMPEEEDISENTYTSQIRPSATSDVVLAEFDVEVFSFNNEIHLTLTPDKTADLPKRVEMDVQEETPDGRITTIFRRRYTVEREVTR